jgi:hypothetical protein
LKHPYDLVELTWDDACSDAGWHATKDVKMVPQIVVTVGFVIREDAKHILMAHTYSGDDFVGWFQVPKKMVISRKVLKKK